MIEPLKSLGRHLLRMYVRSPLRGKSRLRDLLGPWLTPAGGVEQRRVGPCRVPLSHAHEATRNMAYGLYEVRELALIRRLLGPGDTAVDVGANVGYLAAHMTRAVGPAGRVVAFEPSPVALQALRQVAASDRHDTLEVVEAGVSAQSRRATYFETQIVLDKGFGRLDQRPSAKHQQVREVDVDVVSLDDHFDGQPPPRWRLLKIDVEGHEAEVLRGMRRLLAAGARPAILAEATASGSELDVLRDVAAQLSAHGYAPWTLDHRPSPVDLDALPATYHDNLLWRPGG